MGVLECWSSAGAVSSLCRTLDCGQLLPKEPDFVFRVKSGASLAGPRAEKVL